MNVARNSVCIDSDVVPQRKSQVSLFLFILNLQISTKLGKGASFRNLSMTINNENFNVSFCKMVISDILEGVFPKNSSGKSPRSLFSDRIPMKNDNYGKHLFFL